MSLLPITLGVRRKVGTKGAGRPLNPKVTEQQLRQDDYTCRCCGFRAREFQRVVPGYLVPEADTDFVTLCSFCEPCFLLDRAGLSGSGVLIWLPETSQDRLNHLLRAIYVARATPGHPAAELASRALDTLMQRRAEAKKRLGSDDPLLLATVMLESMSNADYAQRGDKLQGIRFLAQDRMMVRTRDGEVNQFGRMVKFWLSPEGPFADWPPQRWQEILSEAA